MVGKPQMSEFLFFWEELSQIPRMSSCLPGSFVASTYCTWYTRPRSQQIYPSLYQKRILAQPISAPKYRADNVYHTYMTGVSAATLDVLAKLEDDEQHHTCLADATSNSNDDYSSPRTQGYYNKFGAFIETCCNELVWLKGANRRGLRSFVTICHKCKRDCGRFWFVLCIYDHVADIADSSTRLT